MNSAWGSRAEILKYFGWTYDYLLWGINWVNVEMMLADGARYESPDDDMLNGARAENSVEVKGRY